MRVQILCLLFFLGSAGNLLAQGDSVTIGSATGYSKIETDGTLEFSGNATVWDDYVVPLVSTKIAGSNGPSFVIFIDSTYALSFLESKLCAVHITAQMPHSWAGTDIYPHIHWSHGAGVIAGNVNWSLEYTWINYDPDIPKPFPNTTTIHADSAVSTTVDFPHLITSFGAIPAVKNTSDGISSILVIRLYRDPDHVNDSFGSNVFGLSFDIHYERNTVGSRLEFIK